MKSYTLGRGVVLLSNGNGYEPFGNVTDFTISIKTEKLEHYSTESGIKVKDAEITKSLDFNVKFEVDELKKETLEKFILGSTSQQSQTAATITDEAINGVKQGFWYKLANYNVSSVVVTDSTGNTTYAEGTDYKVDNSAGAIYIIEGGNIPDNSDILVDYDAADITTDQITGGQQYSITGQLWFKGDPPVGTVVDVLGNVSLTPSGDLSLIGDDWLKVGFEGTFTSKPQIIVRGNR